MTAMKNPGSRSIVVNREQLLVPELFSCHYSHLSNDLASSAAVVCLQSVGWMLIQV